MATVILLGPQRLRPTLRDAVRSLDIKGRLATITAGWEERECEDDELVAHLSGRAFNLQLWERTEIVFSRDPELLAGLRTRKERMRRLGELYSIRLGHALAAARELMRREEPDELLEPEVDSAFAEVRELDRYHLERVREIQHEFDDRYRPAEREELARHREEIAHRIEESAAIGIAGGHVSVLLTRLRLFDIPSLIGLRPVIAWSAGAMALGERVVLFHDDSPQGFDHAEVHEPGLGLYRNLLVFPHARRRLRLDDPERVSLLARRFQPMQCIPMDEGDRIEWHHHYADLHSGTRLLNGNGGIDQVGLP